MKNKLFYIAALLTLLSCSKHPGEVRIQGRFAHLEQGEFYIYSSDRELGRLDTVHIKDGEFAYTMPLQGSCILHLLYPNYSQLTFFAHDGDDLLIEGDARDLNNLEVSGSDDNKLYTSFRKETATMPHAKLVDVARQYILKHPDKLVARHLFCQYWLLGDSISHSQAIEIYDSLVKARPDDPALLSLSEHVHASGVLVEGQPLPRLQLQTRPSLFDDKQGKDTISNESLRGNYLLISFWASWRSGSQSALFRTRKIRREMKSKGKKINALSYSLDVSERALRRVEWRDSIDYYSYCDFLCFDSPLARQWGIRTLPYYVLVSPDMEVIAIGNDWKKDIEPKIEELCL